MYYFQRNISDYRAATAHLSLLEHGVYCWLMDTYYLNESPLTLDERALFRQSMAKSDEEKQAVLDVLDEFFTKTEHGWVNKRCEIEIAKFNVAKKTHWSRKLTKSQRASIQAARNASKINAKPKWLTSEQKEDIAKIYAESAMMTAATGIKHEVDHIVPLRGKTVCGLHVAWNLQVLEAYKNRAKSNILEAE